MTEYPNVYVQVMAYFPDLHKLDDGDYAEHNGFRLRHMTMDVDGVTNIAEITFPEEYYQFWLDFEAERMTVVSRTIPGAEKYLGGGEPQREWARIARLFLGQLEKHCRAPQVPLM